MKVDVVVVGAGVAGLTVARKLRSRGLEVAVVEARDRLGGRVDTDQVTFSRPFDVGAHWFHQDEPGQNPLARWARNQGLSTPADHFPLETSPPGEGKVLQQQVKTQEEHWAEASTDCALSQLPAVTGAWSQEARNQLGPLSVGVELEQASAQDFAAMVGEHADLVVEGGMAGVVERLGAGVPVQLSSPVSLVEWSQRGCWVTTPQGRIEADQVVLTPSVGVLQTDRISFQPALPEWKSRAIHSLQMGHLKKVGFEFPSPVDSRKTSLQLAGSPMLHLIEGAQTTSFVGGATAQAWEQLGEEVAAQRTLGELRSVYGEGLTPRHSRVTHWESDPYSEGSYSAALPGHQGARAELARPVHDRLFFAGEACEQEWATTVAGAWLSGLKAADAVLASRGREF